jgi:hypothetical protein
MQDRVRPFRVLLQGLDSFGRRQYLELNFAAMSLAVHLFRHRQRSGSGADHKPPTLPGYLLLYRERCMPKPVTELSDGFLLLSLLSFYRPTESFFLMRSVRLIEVTMTD